VTTESLRILVGVLAWVERVCTSEILLGGELDGGRPEMLSLEVHPDGLLLGALCWIDD
jgi:hypothetical protein